MPFPVEDFTRMAKSAKRTILVENNSSAQLGGVIREYTGFTCQHQLLKYDGRPFWPEDIASFTKGIL
jgi:2-oxoglutarate/2-oxoacid ferredoxin oxidoreductase subunit alpha